VIVVKNVLWLAGEQPSFQVLGENTF